MKTIIKTEGLTKAYGTRDKNNVLSGIDLEIYEGGLVVIAGPSGSGKSTMLHLIGGLDRPTNGLINVAGKDLSSLSKTDLADFRLRNIGFIFQSYNLLPVLTIKENVEFALQFMGVKRKTTNKKVQEVLQQLGIENLQNRLPSELSGGQQQRVAIARAIVGNPAIVLADEPTANLDSHNAENLIKQMRLMSETMSQTFIIATHDPMVISMADRVIRLKDGRITA